MTYQPHSQSVPHGRGGKAVMRFLDKFYDGMPAFTDVFDEESFYTFAMCFTIATCVAAFVASKYIKIKAKD